MLRLLRERAGVGNRRPCERGLCRLSLAWYPRRCAGLVLCANRTWVARDRFIRFLHCRFADCAVHAGPKVFLFWKINGFLHFAASSDESSVHLEAMNAFRQKSVLGSNFLAALPPSTCTLQIPLMYYILEQDPRGTL